MKIVIPSNRCKKIELPVSADIVKAFEKYYKNSVLVDYENDTITTDILIYSWLSSFAESEEFAVMAQKADEVKAEKKAEKEKAKAEKEAKKAERAKSKEAKQAEKIAKLEAELAKLKADN